jgi:hypothetical protein
VVLIITSLDNGPTNSGVKTAWKEKDPPVSNTRLDVGKLERTKSLLPLSAIPVTVVPMTATHFTVRTAEELPSDTMPNTFGDEQFSGKLTGDPKP